MRGKLLGNEDWAREMVALAGRCIGGAESQRRDQRARKYLHQARSHIGAQAWYMAHEHAKASIQISLQWEPPFPGEALMAGIKPLKLGELDVAWVASASAEMIRPVSWITITADIGPASKE